MAKKPIARASLVRRRSSDSVILRVGTVHEFTADAREHAVAVTEILRIVIHYTSLAERAAEYGAPDFCLSIPETRKCVIVADLSGRAAAPRAGQ
jgi:hypothetical protein